MMSNARGFSLIEMLVVMTIMGLIVSIVTLSIGSYSSAGRNTSVDAFADSLVLLMSTASNEAILSGEPLALSFFMSAGTDDEGVSVSWLRYARTAGESLRSRQSVWQPASAETGLRDLRMPSVISSALSIEGELINLQALADSAGVPALVFYPTGETTGFTWSLSRDDHAITLSNAISGDIERGQP